MSSTIEKSEILVRHLGGAILAGNCLASQESSYVFAQARFKTSFYDNLAGYANLDPFGVLAPEVTELLPAHPAPGVKVAYRVKQSAKIYTVLEVEDGEAGEHLREHAADITRAF